MNSILYVRRFSLGLIRNLIGNQCSYLSRGLLDLVTTRATISLNKYCVISSATEDVYICVSSA